jgi:imidazolonepropionase
MTLVVHRARLVTCDPELGQGPLGVIEPGALVAEGPTIAWVGPESHLAGVGSDAIEVDVGGRAVLPGLVDCHTHLIFAGDRSHEFAARMRGEPYRAGGIQTTVAATRAASDEELRNLAQSRLRRFLAHGVTTVEVKSGYGLDLHQELRLLRVIAGLSDEVTVVPTLLGAHILPDEYRDRPNAYVELVAERMVPAARGLAEFCDAWCEPEGAFTPDQCRRVLRAGLQAGLLPKLHAEQLSRGGGARLAAELGAVSADHLEHATPEDARALATAGTVAVLMPGASMLTGAPFAPARMLIEHGVRVALSTDCNPGTSFSENLPLQVALGCALLRLTPEEAILAVTREAAAALGRGHRSGRLRAGLDCDAVVLQTRNEIDLAYHYGVNLVASVIKGGEVR